MARVSLVIAGVALAALAVSARAQTPTPAQAALPALSSDTTVSSVAVIGKRRPIDPRMVVGGRLLRVDPPPRCVPSEESGCVPWDQVTGWLKDGYAAYDAGDFEGALKIFRQASLNFRDLEVGLSPSALDDVSLGSLMRDEAFLTEMANARGKMGVGEEAVLMAARIYIGGPENLRDVDRGLFWLRRVATTGVQRRGETMFFSDTPYMYNSLRQEAAMRLGDLYREGVHVPRDLAEARRWYALAMREGYVPGAKILADMRMRGEGGDRDIKGALQLYDEAAKAGFAPAQVALGKIYETGLAGVAPDPARARDLYQAASERNNGEALYALAVIYEAGDGVAADPQRAVSLYQAAAEAGDARGAAAYGLHLYEGTVVPKDLTAARGWLQKAATAGDREAMYSLGAMMLRGEGGPADLPRAWALFSLAKTAGHPNATTALAAVERRMTAADRAAGEALLAAKG
jgi:TPR repeat protein